MCVVMRRPWFACVAVRFGSIVGVCAHRVCVERGLAEKVCWDGWMYGVVSDAHVCGFGVNHIEMVYADV